ncbi:hypothetical protein VTN77DRAFT_937 [Rasamsonia byssochlamydoides]|uniref:uncharacterized protein n=1 Tax=Rasamsonia byssochlamydoides TaxID=89139 RepID=UPI0037421D8E
MDALHSSHPTRIFPIVVLIFSLLSSPFVSAAAAVLEPLITPPPNLLIRQDVDQNPQFRGWVSVGKNSYSILYCNSGFTFQSSNRYASCCPTGVGCSLPVGCTSNLLLWAPDYTSNCGTFACETGTYFDFPGGTSTNIEYYCGTQGFTLYRATTTQGEPHEKAYSDVNIPNYVVVVVLVVAASFIHLVRNTICFELR